MTRFPRPFLALPLLAALLVPGPAAAEEVIADDANDVFAISGSVLLDGSFAEARQAATCEGCHWRVVTVCAGGTLDARLNCLRLPCPSTQAVAEVWRAIAPLAPPLGDPTWEYRGLVCLSQPPVSAPVVSAAVRDLVLRSVPALRPAAQPSPSLTGLATAFRAGQPAAFSTAPATVGGVEVTVHATPTWTWDFGHGAPLITADPGTRSSASGVRHVYPRRGTFRVRVTCAWRAVYEARGITDLPVDGVITQSTWFDLRVREARRFLHTTQGA